MVPAEKREVCTHARVTVAGLSTACAATRCHNPERGILLNPLARVIVSQRPQITHAVIRINIDAFYRVSRCLLSLSDNHILQIDIGLQFIQFDIPECLFKSCKKKKKKIV